LGCSNLKVPNLARSNIILWLYSQPSFSICTPPDVSWPRAFKGGFVHGPEAIRAYWTEQWSEIDGRVEPVAFHREDAGQILVDVHQVVRDLAGTLLADEHVGHRFTFEHGLIKAMEVCPLP
jgi:hypothetical protein